MGGEQLELFSCEEMRGLFIPDELDTEPIRAYLWAIRYVADLDDYSFYLVKKLNMPERIGDRYIFPFISETLNTLRIIALRDCLHLRATVIFRDNFIRNYSMSIWKPFITDPHSYVNAKNLYQKYLNSEYQEKGWWLTDLSVEQLMEIQMAKKLDGWKWEMDRQRKEYEKSY